jgi:hypothetical protein
MKKKKIKVNINTTYKYVQLVADIVGIKDHNTLNNYVKSFKDKGVILKKGNTYKLNSFLEPDTNIVEIEINRI